MTPESFLENFNAVKPDSRSGYVLDEYVARGGQAWVYQGHHGKDINDRVAVKIFRQNAPEDEVGLFVDEGRKLKELAACEHIIAVRWMDSIPVSVGTRRAKGTTHYPYIVMQWADGGSVKDYIGTPELTSQRSLSWLTQAMEGMRYAHGELSNGASRAVHRDIKPENLLLVDGRAKIADFGIAVSGHKSDQTITRTQLGAGTGPYMPIEQYTGRAVLSSDIYAMAITGYEMVTGQLPIQRGKNDWYGAHRNANPQPREVFRNGRIDPLAMAMQEVFMKGMARYPKDRYASMGEFQATLLDAAQRVKTSIDPRTTYIDLGAAPKSVDPVATEAYRTQVLTAQYEPTRLATAPTKKDESAPQSGRLSRRQVLFGGGAIVAAGVLGEGARRLFVDDEKAPDKPTPEHYDTPLQWSVAQAKWAIDACLQRKRTNDVFHLVRDLIPVDYQAAAAYIEKMPLETASWLAADLVPYDPATAEKVMKKYEAKKDYVHATRIALALAYYSKEKFDDAKNEGTTYVSGAPQDPKKRAAYDAAQRIELTCDNTDLQDIIDIAQTYTYAYAPFGGQLQDIAVEKLKKLREAGKSELVSMLCAVIVRDNAGAVEGCIDYYVKLADKTTGQDHTAALQAATEIATASAPFAPDSVLEAMQVFAAKSGSDYSASADALAMALAPYKITDVATYVTADTYTHANRFGIGLAVQKQIPELRQHLSPPLTAWLDFIKSPTAKTAKAAKQALTDAHFNNYAYWATAAMLKGVTSKQR